MKKKVLKSVLLLPFSLALLVGCNEEPEEGGENKPTCQHNFDDWFVDSLPSESQTGKASRVCILCDTTEEVDLPKIGESEKYSYGNNTATCTLPGTQLVTYTVSEGNEIQFTVNTSAKGHDYVHHDATTLTPEVKVGTDEYYTCSRCDQLFDKNKVEIESLDEIKTYYYQFDTEGHWHGDIQGKVAHNFTEYQETKAATYFEDGEKSRTCNDCGYEEKVKIDALDIGTLSSDGVYSAASISNVVVDGANKLTDGLYVFGKDAEKDSFDKSNGNITFGGKSNPDSRVYLIKTAGPAQLIVKAAAGKAGELVNFGIYDGQPDEESDNFVSSMGLGSSSTSSTADYTFNIPTAGKYWFGGDAKLKVKSITVEAHAIDMDNWQKDATTHWHGNSNPACTCRLDQANHEFGDWEDNGDGVNDKKSCSVCGYTVVEAKENHAGCQHKYVATINTTKGVVEYVCSECTDTYTKGYSLFLPSTADASGETVNVMAHAEGTAYSVNDATASSWYKGKMTAGTLEEAHEFTMGDGKTKRSFTNYAGTKVGGNVGSNYCSITVPGACEINIYMQSGGSPNPRYTIVGGAENQNMFTSKPADDSFYTFNYTMSGAGEMRIGSTNTTSNLLIFAIEIIY